MYISAAVKNIFEESRNFRLDAASDSNTSPNILSQLANDPSANVRWLVARNKATPLSALLKLLDDPYYEVRLNALGNPNLPDTYKFYANLDKHDVSGKVAFEIAVSNYDPDYKDGITKIFTDYFNNKGYELQFIDFDTPAEYSIDDDTGYMSDDCDIEVTVSSIFDEDDIEFMLDDLMEILEHEVGLDIEDSTYIQLLNNGGRFT